MPPMIEYLESLLTGTGHDLDLQTFKLTDQLTGRMLGVRADMTPQAARIDAHPLKRDDADTPVLSGYGVAHPAGRLRRFAQSVAGGRELFGHGGIESDLEILEPDAGNAGADGHRRTCTGPGACRHLPGLAERPGLDEPRRKPTCSMPCSARRCRKSKLLAAASPGTRRRRRRLASLAESATVDGRCLSMARERLAGAGGAGRGGAG